MHDYILFKIRNFVFELSRDFFIQFFKKCPIASFLLSIASKAHVNFIFINKKIPEKQTPRFYVTLFLKIQC